MRKNLRFRRLHQLRRQQQSYAKQVCFKAKIFPILWIRIPRRKQKHQSRRQLDEGRQHKVTLTVNYNSRNKEEVGVMLQAPINEEVVT